MDVRRTVSWQAISDWFGSLADRLGVTPGAIVVGACAIVVAAGAGWWSFRAPDPLPVEQVLPLASASGPVVAATPSVPATPRLIVVVHVDGAVRRAGVHELPAGARVFDAIEAAGGLLAEADRERLNLAAPVSDGQRVWVPFIGIEEPGVIAPTGGVGPSISDNSVSGPVNLNTADQAALETLPGVGPSIASAILRHRETEGRFERVEDLLEVAGIGPSRLEQLEALVTI